MKVIFLDIDGVFVPQRASFLPGQDLQTPKLMPLGEGDPAWPIGQDGRRWKPVSRKLDPVAVSLLARLVQLSGAKVVAVSSWRWHPAAGKGAIERAFREAGFDVAEAWHEDWATVQTMSDDRAREMGEWFEDHPDVQRWVAFEDSRDLQAPGTIYVDSVDGMSFANYRKALLLLDVLDESFGPGGGWPLWTEWGEREAIRRWLDHAFSAQWRRSEASKTFDDAGLSGADRQQKWRERMEEIGGLADQHVEAALKEEDPWTAEGGPGSFLRDPESIERRIPELRQVDEERELRLTLLGYPGLARRPRRRPGYKEKEAAESDGL